MTKTEKKKIIASQLDEIINLTDNELIKIKISKVISEIRSAKYKPDDMARVDKIINELSADFENHQGDKSYLFLSRAGLMTCIDWSLLPD